MRMSPLRAVNRIRGRLHPAQVILGAGLEVFFKCIARLLPLSSPVARIRPADLVRCAVGGVYQVKSDVRMIGIAQHLGSSTIRGNMPGVEIRDPRDLTRVPAHSLESEWPNHEDQVASF